MHDEQCDNADCASSMQTSVPPRERLFLLRLCKIIQRASREMAGYFMGYTFKGQPVGKKVYKLVDKSFDYLSQSLAELPEEKRFRRTAIRSMVDFHHSTTNRPATEEALLSMHAHEHGVKNCGVHPALHVADV